MRILIVSALLIATASCAWPPPPAEMAAPPPAAAAVPAPVPPPVALMAPPPFAMPPPPVAVAAPPPPPTVAVVPAPVVWIFGPPPPGRLTLSNFSFDSAHVEAVITGAPDCAPREGTATSDFVLPLNGTRVIQSVPGADICWRRAIEPGAAPRTARSTPAWTEWNRAFLSSGRSVDSRL